MHPDLGTALQQSAYAVAICQAVALAWLAKDRISIKREVRARSERNDMLQDARLVDAKDAAAALERARETVHLTSMLLEGAQEQNAKLIALLNGRRRR